MVGHAEKPDDTGAKKCYNGGKQEGHNGTDSPEEGTERTDGMARLKYCGMKKCPISGGEG